MTKFVKRLLAAFVGALSLAVVGCGDDDPQGVGPQFLEGSLEKN